MRDEISGRFTKTLSIWDGSNYDEGWVDNKGRFRVYRPDYPRAYAGGYALRAHVVWWLAHGYVHPEGTDLHHINEIKTDDRLDNLAVQGHVEHIHNHRALEPIEIICLGCGKHFIREASVVHSRIHQGRPIKYCSNACYQSIPRTKEHKQAISNGLKLAYMNGVR
jgi:hypothetical protein